MPASLPRPATPLPVLLLLLLAAPALATPSRFHAALCLQRSAACTPRLARQTAGYCKPSLRSALQPQRCRVLACKWCALPSKARTPLCDTNPVWWICQKLLGSPIPAPAPVPKSPPPKSSPIPIPSTSSKPKPTVSSKPKPTAPGGAQRPCPRNRPLVDARCTWRPNAPARTDFVIDLGAVAPPTGWTCVRRGAQLGWIYERNKNLGIDWKGSRGKRCFKMMPRVSGAYYFTALSYAPHNTEHNDMWVNSPDHGFELWQFGKFWRSASTKEWLKAYQNNGVKGLIDQLKTKDFDGHRFLIPNVRKGRVFRVCVSGRSYKYEVFRLFVIKCKGNNCQGVPLHGLWNRPASKCFV